MTIPETLTSVDDVTIQLYDLGGDGPLLLLSHATGFCGQVWEPMAETLTEHYHCVTFDHRAHGRSTRPVGRPLEWSGMADDILTIVEALSPGEPVAAVGHSMGGTTLALAELAKPGTISKAWTFEPILFGETHLGRTANRLRSPRAPVAVDRPLTPVKRSWSGTAPVRR